MKEAQQQVQLFNDTRKWNEPAHFKELLLNMHEEIDKIWSIIRYADVRGQERLLMLHKETVEDALGDMTYLLLTITHQCNADAAETLKRALEKYEQRHPLSEKKAQSKRQSGKK